MEIIIVNDGSTDNTLEVAKRLARQHQPRIRVVTYAPPNRGKATALNKGIARSKGDIIVCIDTDSIFLPNTVEQLVLSFEDPKVMAVGGNVKVANRRKVLSRQQSLEYITGLTLQRKAFAYLGCMQVISGAVGAFRRNALMSIGGYSTNTIVEDMDTTIELVTRGYKVVYNPLAVAYTEAPESLKAFMKQRYRWTYGSFQVLAKHRHTLGRRHTSRMGFIGLPFFLIAPWLQVILSALFVLTLFRAFAADNGASFFIVWILMCVLQTLLTSYALVTDKEDKKLIALALADSLFYYHLLSYTTFKAGFNYLRKKETRWNKLQRYGKNVLPVSGQISEPQPQPVLEPSS